jgi:heptosyltransferase-1
MTRIISRGPDIKRIGSEYLHLMEALGLTVGEFPMEVVLSSDAEKRAGEKLRLAGIQGRYAVICPFTTRPQKHWIEERWAMLGFLLQEQMDLPVVVLGGPEDREASKRIHAQSQGTVFDFAGAMMLEESAAAVKGADLVIGVDTGLTHMGVAFERPTVSIFGATCPYLDTATPRARVLYEKMPCSPCKRSPTCDGQFPCMRKIGLDRVFHAAEELLHRPGVADDGTRSPWTKSSAVNNFIADVQE